MLIGLGIVSFTLISTNFLKNVIILPSVAFFLVAAALVKNIKHDFFSLGSDNSHRLPLKKYSPEALRNRY